MSIILAVLAAIGFGAATLLAFISSRLTAQGRAYAIAIAAASLLVLSIGDLFPDSLAAAGHAARAGFIGGFALLFVVEMVTHAHIHHAPGEPLPRHTLASFILGLAIHNLADGFAIGISATRSSTVVGLVGLGVLVHQIPVGLSCAAVLIAARVPRATVLRLALLLGLMIPLAAVATIAMPVVSEYTSGILLSMAGGILLYIATTHLLPEAHAEHPRATTGIMFIGTLLIMTLLIFMLGD